MLRKICLLLACVLALSSFAWAEEAPAAYTAEDFLGEWELYILVSEGMHMNMISWGISIGMTVNEDGTAVIAYSDDSSTEMTWRIDEDGRAWLAGYSPDAEVEMGFAEDGSLFFGDEIGDMYFLRPEALAALKAAA